jgi:Transposase DNA-binding/Transposase DDE domain
MFTKIGEEIHANSWFNDSRLSARAGTLIEQLGNNIGKSIPESTGTDADTRAAYRFVNNPKVTGTSLYSASSYACAARLDSQEGQIYLAIADTTTVNCSELKSREGLRCLNGIKQKGFFCHTLLLTDAEGCPEGLLEQEFYDRAAETLGDARKLSPSEHSKIPIEAKESYRWIRNLQKLHQLVGHQTQNTFVLLMDSEGDIFELFSVREHPHIHILTRVQHNRCLWIDKKQRKGELQPTHLKTAVAGMPCAGCIGLQIRDDKTEQKRYAQLEVRYRKVTIAVPHDLKSYHKEKNYEPIPIGVIEVREITPLSEGQIPFEPLHWFLITSLPLENFAQALQVIHFYTLRWRVEDFHVVLKQGCAIEKLQFKQKHALQNLIALYSIVAVQHLRLRYLHEVQPDAPMEVLGLPAKAYSVTEQYLVKIRKIKLKTVEKPTIADFFKLIALLATGNAKNIGFRALWIGISKFQLIWDTYCAFNDS